MKKYALLSVVAVMALNAAAQINSPDNDGLIERARNMAQTSNFKGALDQLQAVDRESLTPDSREVFDMNRAMWLFGAGRFREAEDAFKEFCTQYPYSQQREIALKGRADCLFALDNFKGALEIYNRVQPDGLPSEDAAMLEYRKGLSALSTGDDQAARTALEKAAGYPSTRSAALFFLGCMAFESGDYATARERFRGVNTSVAPGDMTDFYLASIDFTEGNYGKALSTARQMLRRQNLPAQTAAELTRIAGESLYRQGQKTDGVAYLRRYLGMTSDPVPSAMYIVGHNEFEQGNYAAALKLFNPVTEQADGALRQSAYLYAGQCLLEEGDTAAAILAFDKAAKATDDSAVREAAFYNYAAAKFAGASVPFASAADTFEEFLRLYPSGPYSDRVAAYLAAGYMADNDYERALARLNSIANPSPKLSAARQRVLYTLGTTALRDGNLFKAEKYLEEAAALEKFDKETAAETVLSQARLMQAKGDDRKAAAGFTAYLNRAAKSAANRPVALYGLAYSYYNLQDAGRAADYFAQAEKTLADPAAKADALNRLGDISFARGEFNEAAEFYDRAYAAAPASGDYAALNSAKMKGYNRDYQGKLDALAAFRSRFPSSVLMPDALLETTQAQISMGRNADAVATYRELIADYPQTAQGRRGYLQMAMTLLDMNRRDEAAEAYRSVISLYPTSDEAAQASSLLKIMYADAGRADEYLAFMNGVDNAPRVDPDEAEALSFESARNAYEQRGESAQLENFARQFASSPKASAALGILFDGAVDAGDNDSAAALAARINERYPDSRAAERATLFEARTAYADGNLPDALEKYKRLAAKASDATTATEARLGMMRTARDLGDFNVAGEAADAILASSASATAQAEARYTKAAALDATGNTAEALDIWLDMASDPSGLFGARSAVEAADALHEAGNDDKALEVAQKFVQSGSPQRYWVARGFIVLSDIYAAKGKPFEAKEYLQALRDNYPGTEADIFIMIDSRLSDLNSSAK